MAVKVDSALSSVLRQGAALAGTLGAQRQQAPAIQPASTPMAPSLAPDVYIAPFSPEKLFGAGVKLAATTTINGQAAGDWFHQSYVDLMSRAGQNLDATINRPAVSAGGATVRPEVVSPSHEAGLLGRFGEVFQTLFGLGRWAVNGVRGLLAPIFPGLKPAPVAIMPIGGTDAAPVAPAPAPAPAPTPAPPPPAPRTYTVVKGDTLWAISGRELGDPRRWPEIYAANRDVIGANPNLIYPGQVYRLPGAGGAAPAPAKPAPAPAQPAPQPGGKWAWPVSGRISSNFGNRADPFTGKADFHTGLDIAAASGTPIRSPLGGRVVFAGPKGGYGNYVIIDHGNGLQTAYAHQSAILVSAGQQIGAGHVIGKVGSTGYSTGPHLHFEVKRGGQFVDPRPFLS